jgi:hypothetical protein
VVSGNQRMTNVAPASEQAEGSIRVKKTRLDQIKLKEVTEDVFRLIDKRDKNGIIRTLESNSSIPIIDIVDSRGYTVLHMCCFKNLEDITNAIMEKALETVKEPLVTTWVN